jgi:adenylate cyclase
VAGTEHPTPEDLAAAGIYDPDDERSEERLALIGYLMGLGATVDELVDAYPDLPQVASARALRGAGERFTQDEAAARADVPFELARRIWRATGFPDPGPDATVFTDEDVEVLRTFRAGAELLGEEVMLQVARVMGSSMMRIADAIIAAFVVNVAAPSLEEDPGGLALARANWEGIELLRQASSAMDSIFRRHMERLQRPLAVGDQRTQQLAVGFADLVGSTALAQRLPIRDLSVTLAEFEALVSDVVVAGGGRVVKLIGDEVMYVCTDPSAACAIALELAARLDEHPDLPAVRGGLEFGAVLTRDGDCFGPVVNVASRITKLAEPGTVLGSSGIRDAVDAVAFASSGTCEIKGFEVPVELFELRRG